MEIKVTLTQLNTPTHQGKVWWDGVPSQKNKGKRGFGMS